MTYRIKSSKTNLTGEAFLKVVFSYKDQEVDFGKHCFDSYNTSNIAF